MKPNMPRLSQLYYWIGDYEKAITEYESDCISTLQKHENGMAILIFREILISYYCSGRWDEIRRDARGVLLNKLVEDLSEFGYENKEIGVVQTNFQKEIDDLHERASKWSVKNNDGVKFVFSNEIGACSYSQIGDYFEIRAYQTKCSINEMKTLFENMGKDVQAENGKELNITNRSISYKHKSYEVFISCDGRISIECSAMYLHDALDYIRQLFEEIKRISFLK